MHVAEGVDDVAADEIDVLAERGLLGGHLIAVHGVGIKEAGVDRFRASGAALVWCPTSNAFLFGRTAPDRLLADGVDVLLGSDSLLTGAGNLLDELGLARALGTISDERLEAAVGVVAARRLGLAPPSLAPGADADIVLLRRPLLEASAEHVDLVMVGGVPRVASRDLGSVLARHFRGGRSMTVAGVTQWVNERLAAA
jgi:cytosine/adenosine deaminase-related metal-dependent hydrolase